MGGELLLVLLGVIGLNMYLWRSFRPLQSAIGFTVNDYCKKVLGERYPMRSEGALRV